MNEFLVPPRRNLLAIALLLTAPLTLHAAGIAPTVAKPRVAGPVSITDDGAAWTLNNGIVKFTVNKGNGNLPSIVYKGIPIVGHTESWEQLPSGQVTASVTIDPAKNGGDRAEIAVKGINGRMDIEVRYTLERGASGFYVYAQYSHEASYPAAGEGESRFVLEMNPTFDWLSVDADRNMPMCSGDDLRQGVVVHAKEQRILNTGIYKNSVEHKYSYCAEMYKLPAYGWSSIRDHVGIWFINPSNEYLGGGPTRIDLVCHMSATILDYWTSGHYAGGAECNVPAGEKWSKVVGPIYVYFNALENPQAASSSELDTLKASAGNPTVPASWTSNANALFADALAEAKTARAQWPYPWVQGVDYPQKIGRATVTGQLVLTDPQATVTTLPHLWVGLTHADFTGAGGDFARRSGNGNLVTWDHDADYYQFWAEGSADGRFTLGNVRPGSYTLHAFADGVLGEFAQTNITVGAGKAIDLGKLAWKPLRRGKQIWEIGYPDRTGGKFLKGDGANYWRWGWGLRYSLLFPNDLTYTVGKSDYHKDWFFQQVPHSENQEWLNPEAKDPANQHFGWVKGESQATYPNTDQSGPWRLWGRGRATTWKIKFDYNQFSRGEASLRVALAGADGAGGLAVAVNGRSVGTINTVGTNALRYNTDKGMWRQYLLTFDAALLRSGGNEMQLTVPAGDVTSGVVYDYLRLEVDENHPPESTSLLLPN